MLRTIIVNLALVAAVLYGIFWFVRRSRRIASGAYEKEQGKQRVAWSDVFVGLAFLFYGVAALVRGEADVELGVHVQGLHVRIAGALLSVVGGLLAISGFRTK